MKKIIGFLLLVMFAIGGTGFAENWIGVGRDTKGYEWMYDGDTVLNDGTGHYTVTIAKVHEKKSTWYKAGISIVPLRRLSSLNRWEEHKKGKTKYIYWTYDYQLKGYGSESMYEEIGESLRANY